MNLDRLSALVGKEMLEIRKNRMLLFTIFFPPLLFVVMPLGIIGGLGTASTGGQSNIDLVARMIQGMPELAGLSEGEIMQVVIMRQFLLFFLLMPLIIPLAIAAYSIIGEKEMRSLEPLLATPVSTLELLLGKSIAAVVPAVLTTWVAYVIFFIGARFVVASDRVYARLLDPMWVLAMLIVAPLLSLLSVSIGVIISSRVNDTRAAQQIGGVIVVPIVALGIAQTAGFVFLNLVTFIVGAFIIALVDLGVLYVGTQLFRRETILTQWK